MISWRTSEKRIGTLCRNNSGIAAVEVGITLLPFLLVVFGVAEFGWYFLHTHTMNAAVGAGIRVGTTGQTLTAEGGAPLSREDSIKQAIIAKASSIMVIDPADIKMFQVDADWTDPDDPAVVNAAAAGAAGAFMRVRVLYQHQFFSDFIGGFFSPTSIVTLSSEGTYMNENFIVGGPPAP